MIGYKTRNPVDHQQRWLQASHKKAKESGHKSPRRLISFVCGEAARIASLWDKLLRDDSEWDEVIALVSHDDEVEAVYRKFIVENCFQLRSDFQFRVLSETNSFPMLILWLVHKSPDVECRIRKVCANDILEYSTKEALTHSLSLTAAPPTPSCHRFHRPTSPHPGYTRTIDS